MTNLKYILLIGIGGPYSGPKAVYDALHHHGDPVMLFASTISTHERAEIERALADIKNSDEVVVIYASKSGTTMETLDNFEYFYDLLIRKLGSIDERVIAITSEGSQLWKQAQEKKWRLELIPQEVGGRFSVFTPAGIVPLELAGIDVKKFQKGGKAGAEGSAEEIFKQYQQGFRVHNLFLFNPELESLGKWWRQLTGESLGKHEKGTLPIVSIGTNDLHSTYQIYLDGPKDIYTTFVSAEPLPKIVHAILEGVKISYQNRGLPFRHITLPELNAYQLGVFMQTQMNEVIALAKLMGVDAFNQPAVEEYKKEARRLLSAH
ncbi:MAG: hypothetical protein A3A33_04625 [Candidatus Yanofskybacteria bacterium RIFCSPLOWO2_01_FULL_49_25]|uniref:Glucose-6-phosphate isomerase n=1 Tax=Candidatus Yanofskybacteria bacterium RIFCSPLOWO2_01_FULL_49_25 TaxID=1802701 RepID=A0A1F8GRF8_9BACT|nr:MAG: hypothetical protein A3A33_04625 [Candidatus Yanofskybacteria bacterium RIFCSPLOWO2_01_FULL_49_25]